jgi:hypothetical protein
MMITLLNLGKNKLLPLSESESGHTKVQWVVKLHGSDTSYRTYISFATATVPELARFCALFSFNRASALCFVTARSCFT